MELLHGLDAVCLQKAEQGGALLQSSDFAGAGAGSVQLLLGFPQGDQAALLRLWFFRFGFRPEIKTGNAGFDFFQQLVVGGDLPVYFALVGADAALFHLAGGWPQKIGRASCRERV